MKLFVKAIPRREQILARRNLNADGIEILLNEAALQKPDFDDLIKLASDSFPKVGLEVGDTLEKGIPVDLLDVRSRKYIEAVLDKLQGIPNHSYLVAHLVGGCVVKNAPYLVQTILTETNIIELLSKCLEYVNKLDPENKIIALENTFPTDWMDEETGLFSFYPMGKIVSNFKGRAMTFDVAHSGVTMHTFVNGYILENDWATYSSEFGRIPFYFGREEKTIAEIAKSSLTDAVCDEIGRANIANVHFNSSYRLLDGFSVGEESDLNLYKILRVLLEIDKKREIQLVVETKERSTGDYLKVPNQRAMLSYVKEIIKQQNA